MTSRTNRRGFANLFIYPKGLRVDTVKIEPSERGDTLTMKLLVQCVME